MTASPRVSVVIPTWNRAPLLVEAIRSVLAQTFQDLEIIVCDDGSTDDTEARVREFGPTVRYLGFEHTGRPGIPRNRGVEAARGEWVAFLDDDDLWAPTKIARQVELFESDPGLGLVSTGRVVLYPDGSRSEPVLPPASERDGPLLDQALAAHFPSLVSLMVRRDLIVRLGGFDEATASGGDVDLLLRLARVARAAGVPEPLLIVRRQSGSLSQRGAIVFEEGIAPFERQLAAGGLTRAQRRRCRATLAWMYVQLSELLAVGGERGGARRAAFRAVRHRPTSRRAWVQAFRAWLGRQPRAAGAVRSSTTRPSSIS